MEALEAQRCVSFLNKNSKVVIDDSRILPYSVNAGAAEYPNTVQFIEYLRQHISDVLYIEKMPKGISLISRNVFVAGCASQLEGFPVKYEHIEKAIRESGKSRFVENSLKALEHGKNYTLENITV